MNIAAIIFVLAVMVGLVLPRLTPVKNGITLVAIAVALWSGLILLGVEGLGL